MRNRLRILAAVIGLLTLLVWGFTGAHTGWTKTRVTEMQIDPITELEYPVTRNQFVAGVEVLGGGLLLSLALVGGSFIFKKQPINH
jgi:hypothetical protein